MVGPLELTIIVVLILFLFGYKKIPDLARAIGRAPGEARRGHREEPPDE